MSKTLIIPTIIQPVRLYQAMIKERSVRGLDRFICMALVDPSLFPTTLKIHKAALIILAALFCLVTLGLGAILIKRLCLVYSSYQAALQDKTALVFKEKSLPLVMTEQILSFLPQQELEKLPFVCSSFKSLIIDQPYEQTRAALQVVKFLIQHITTEKYPKVIEALTTEQNNLLSQLQSKKQTSQALKKAILLTKTHLIETLKQLEEADLLALRTLFDQQRFHPPFHQLLELAGLYKQLLRAQEPHLVLAAIELFAEKGFFDEALQIVQSRLSPKEQSKALATIAKAMASRGAFERATALAKTLKGYSSDCFMTIGRSLAKAGKLQELEIILDLIQQDLKTRTKITSNSLMTKDLLREWLKSPPEPLSSFISRARLNQAKQTA